MPRLFAIVRYMFLIDPLGLGLYGLMSSVISQLTVTLPLPSHWGHGSG